MLETHFPRVLGDGGHAGTWPFPVLYRVVREATPKRVVSRNAEGLLPSFVTAARELIDMGADGIAANCGFLSLFQEELATACGVPVLTSSLMQVPWVQATLPEGKKVGVVTISKSTLTARHLECAGAPLDTPIEGTEDGRELSRAILGDESSLNVEQARQDVIDAGRRLVDCWPEVSAIVLECTNMGPFAGDLNDTLGLPVFDFYSCLSWFQSGLSPRRF